MGGFMWKRIRQGSKLRKLTEADGSAKMVKYPLEIAFLRKNHTQTSINHPHPPTWMISWGNECDKEVCYGS